MTGRMQGMDDQVQAIYDEINGGSIVNMVETLARLDVSGQGMLAVRVIQKIAREDGQDVADLILDRAIARGRELAKTAA